MVDFFPNNPKYPKCPHCNQTIGFTQRLERCAYSGELVCTKCIINGRYSDTVAPKIPAEYHQKFRWLNFLPWLVISILMYSILGTAWWNWDGYDIEHLEVMIIGMVIIVAKIIAFLILFIMQFRLPKLGTWVFYKWIQKPQNREKLDQDMVAYAKNEWVSSSKAYLWKQKFVQKAEVSKFSTIYILTMILNVAMIPLFIIVRFNLYMEGTLISVIAGIVYMVGLLFSITTIILGSGFYCNKSPENRKQRQIVEGLGWSYMLLFPLVFIPQVLSLLILLGFGEDINISRTVLYNFFLVAQFVQWGVMMVLPWKLMHSIPDFKIDKDFKAKPIFAKNSLQSIYQLIRRFVILIFFLLLVVIYGLSLELLLTDVAMFFCVLSYLLVIIYGLIIFIVLKLVNRVPQNRYTYRRPYHNLVKIGAIIIIINFIPTIGTLTWTNPSVENQFIDVFGADWKSKISDDEYTLMHQYSFSAFDAYFGYDIPTNSKLENVYMVDSPRYVKNESSGIIVSNGTSKYDAIKQKMIFDAYLPAGSGFNTTFDDGKTTKFPVIIMMHGIGMDRGSGNANLTTQYLANLGYLAIDMSYGFSGYCNVNYISGKEKGYDFPDTIQQIGNFTKYLDAHQDEYHADMTNVYFAGRSFGGWMASVCAYGYNNTFMAGNFSSNMIVRGCIPYYPAYDIPSVGMNLLNEFVDVPYFRGSDNPLDADYNPEWIYYRVPELISSTVTTGKLCPTLMFQGTGDYLVNPGWNRQYEAKLREFNSPVIAAYYPQGSHGFDAYHASPYGQSVLYYFARFLALTH